MRRRWIRWTALLLVTVLFAGVVTVFLMARDWTPSRPDPIPRGDHGYTRELAAYRLHELVDRHHLPGCAAALIVGQEVVWQAAAGFADVAEDRPVTGETVFKLWSLGKLFTALEVLRLVEEGEIDLDAPIATYVPGFHVPSRFEPCDPITVRHLLTHHSGLPRNDCVDESNWHLGADGAERLAAALADCRLVGPPGRRYKYSNTAYDLLGYLIQARRGAMFPPYMKRGLLEPIGMVRSSFWSTDLPQGASPATGYHYADGEQVPLTQHDVATVPSGNLYGSLDDLVAFVRFLFRGGEAGGKRLVRPETLDRMLEVHGGVPGDPHTVGLGWRLSNAISGQVLAWHDGGPVEGSGVLVATLPGQKLGAVFVGNSTAFESSFVLPVVVELLDVMLETELGIRAPEQEPPTEVEVEASVLRAHAGGYVAFGSILEVRPSGDGLEAILGGTTFDLIPRSENTFGVSHWVHRLGLQRLFGLPYDLDAMEVEFLHDDAGDRLVFAMGGTGWEIAPRYAPLLGSAASWEGLTGAYERRSRRPDGSLDADRGGEAEIRWIDGRLVMSGSVGPVFPLEGGGLVVLGGPFAGETILRDESTGVLSHQGTVYVPAR